MKFEQNQMIGTILNLELVDKKSFTVLTISDISLAPFEGGFSETYIFHYSKDYGSLTRVTRLKVEVNMSDAKCLLGDSSYP